MRQRLGLASSLIRRPQLLLLDEPANGVDPAGIRFLRGLLQRLADEGMTILLSSHLLSEVQEVCNRVAVINDGRIVHEGLLAELGANASRYRLQTTDDSGAAAALARVENVTDLRHEQHELSFRLAADDVDTVRVTRALAEAGIGINELVREHATLEELFFRLTESPDETAAVAA
jgi:ABC-2 type transport system ATP-binding protein